MTSRLTGKIALITGGARGQGQKEAERFAAQGATVLITDVLDDEGSAVAAALGDSVSFRHHDVTSESDWADVVAAVVEEHGRIDVLVNNAGVFSTVRTLDTSLDLWNRTVSINQTGVFLGIREAGRAMCEHGAGSIINISSVAGLNGSGGAYAYTATKWAVRGMTKAAARDFASHGVRVNSVHPGLIETSMLDELGAARDRATAMVPMGRTGSVDEVADLVLFLASDESSYCTGHEFVIDGGISA